MVNLLLQKYTEKIKVLKQIVKILKPLYNHDIIPTLRIDYMSSNQGNSFVNNIIFALLLVFLIVGAVRNFSGGFSMDAILSRLMGQKETTTWNSDEVYTDPRSIFDTVQGERVRHKISYATAMQFIHKRSLTGTEIQELGKRQPTSEYFVRNGSKKLIFYPTTGTDEVSQQFMRDFTRLRTSLRHRKDLIFIPVETAFISSERQIKTSSDRVFYNVKRECGKFCIIDVSSYTITSLDSPGIGVKTYEVIEAVVNSL